MAEPARQFSFWVFDNFGKVYVSIEDLAVRRMYVETEQATFHVQSAYTNLPNKWFFLPTAPSNTVLQMVDNPMKHTIIWHN